jgi:hypothetical protein
MVSTTSKVSGMVNSAVGKLSKKNTILTTVLSVILFYFIICKITVPDNLAHLVNNVYGHLIIVGLSFFIFTKSNPVVAIMFAFAAFAVLNRSGSTAMYSMHQYIPSEDGKELMMMNMNEQPGTLEEEVVAQVIPLMAHADVTDNLYQPKLSCDTGNAAMAY